MTDRGQKIRLGLFVFGALAALATLIVMFGKKPGAFFKDRVSYPAVFDNAPGIQKGTPLRRSGVNIGEVESVALEESGKVRVVFRIDKQFRPRENEVPAINQALLTGDSIVEMILNPEKRDKPLGPVVDPDPDKPMKGRGPLTPRDVGQRAEPLLDVSQRVLVEMEHAFKEFSRVAPEMRDALRESSATLQSIREAVPELRKTNDGVQGMLAAARVALPKLEQTNNQAQKTLLEWGNAGEQVRLLVASNQDKVSKTIDKMNAAIDSATVTMDTISKTAERANRVMSDENIKNINTTLVNVKQGTDKFPALADSADGLMKDASTGIKRFNQTAEKAEAALENISRTTKSFADRSDPILKNVQDGSEQFKQLVFESRQLLNHFARSEGTIGKLFNDPSLYNSANDSLLMLSRMAPRLERILADLETFSDKVARHPELVGARGVFKPDSGLKASPHAPLPSTGATNPWAQPKY